MNERPVALIIEDELELSRLLAALFTEDGFDVIEAETGALGLAAAARVAPAFVLLDLSLPDMDGFEVAEGLRALDTTRDTRILVVTGSDLEDNMVRALAAFADDYIVKPIKPRVLLARVSAVLRRGPAPDGPRGDVLKVGRLLIEPATYEVRADGQRVELTRTEFNILLLMARNVETILTRPQIIDAIHGSDYAISDRSVDFQIHGLRRKLGTLGELITTVRGVGFKLRVG